MRRRALCSGLKQVALASIAVAVTCAPIGKAAPTEPSASKLTLHQAVRLAVERSPNLITSASEIDVAAGEKRKALAAFFPQADVQTTQGLLSGANQRTGSSASLALTENLFDSGLSLLNYDSSSLRKRIAELSFLNARDALSLEIARQFARYSLSQKLLEVQQTQFDTIKKQHGTIEGLYKQGLRTRKDFLRFTTELRRSEIQLVNARVAIDRTAVELRRLLGQVGRPIGNLEIPPLLSFEPLEINFNSVEKIPAQAPDIRQHFQYQIAELQSEVFQNDITSARLRYWPQLFLTAQAGYVQDDFLSLGRGLSGGTSSQWSVLAQIKWNLMDWGIRRYDVQIARRRKTIQEQQIQERLNAFAAENENLLLNLRQSHNAFQLSRELLDLESKTFSFLQTEYQNGKVTYLDLIVGLRDLLNARVQLFTSYFELQQLLFQYRYHEGRLYETLQES